jgi:hypothetical protein
MMGLMGATSRRVPLPPQRRGVHGLLLAVLCALLLTGCPGSSQEPAEPGETGESADDQAALQIELAEGDDDLGREARNEVQRQVGDVLSTYVVAAFLGDYPRDDFVDSLSVFTSGAADNAARDLDLLTARRYGDAEGVRAEQLRARVSVFAADDEAAGASADVRFRFTVDDGDQSRTFRMVGRVSLVREVDDWRIFAYDVSRQDPPEGQGETP